MSVCVCVDPDPHTPRVGALVFGGVVGQVLVLGQYVGCCMARVVLSRLYPFVRPDDNQPPPLLLGSSEKCVGRAGRVMKPHGQQLRLYIWAAQVLGKGGADGGSCAPGPKEACCAGLWNDSFNNCVECWYNVVSFAGKCGCVV